MMSQLVRLPEIRATMMAMSREMTKVWMAGAARADSMGQGMGVVTDGNGITGGGGASASARLACDMVHACRLV